MRLDDMDSLILVNEVDTLIRADYYGSGKQEIMPIVLDAGL